MIWKAATAILAGALACVVLMAQSKPQPKVVEAERFVVRDPIHGKVVAELGFFERPPENLFGDEDTSPEPFAGIFIYGPGGKEEGAEVGMLVTYDGRSWSDPAGDGRWPEPLIFMKEEGQYKALKPAK